MQFLSFTAANGVLPIVQQPRETLMPLPITRASLVRSERRTFCALDWAQVFLSRFAEAQVYLSLV